MGKKSKLVPVTVWLPERVKEQMKRRADRLGVSLSAYLGDKAAREQEIFMACSELNEIQDLRFQLYKIGATLNQIAVSLNMVVADGANIASDHVEWLEEVGVELRCRLRQMDKDLVILRPVKLE